MHGAMVTAFVAIFSANATGLSAAAESPEAALPTVAAVHVQGPVRIDGKLDEAFWKGVPEHGGFHLLGKGDRTDDDTHFRVAFDGEAIVLGITCRQDMKQIMADAVVYDQPVWKDDSVEVMLQHNDRYYYHFAVNSIGTLMDARYPVKKSLTSADFAAGVLWDGIEQAAAHRWADRWTVELRIPLASLDIGPNAPAGWRMEIARNFRQNNTYSSWAPVQQGFHDLARYGHLTGIDIQDGEFPISAEELTFPPMLLGDNPVQLKLPAASPGPYRVRVWMRDASSAQATKRLIHDKTITAAGGILADKLEAPVTQAGVKCELTLEIDDAKTGRPVLLRGFGVDAPDPLNVSLKWPVYYESDQSIRVAALLDVMPNLAVGQLIGTVFQADTDKPAARYHLSIDKAGPMHMDIPLKELPDGFYRLQISADLADQSRWVKDARFFKTAGPFDNARK